MGSMPALCDHSLETLLAPSLVSALGDGDQWARAVAGCGTRLPLSVCLLPLHRLSGERGEKRRRGNGGGRNTGPADWTTEWLPLDCCRWSLPLTASSSARCTALHWHCCQNPFPSHRPDPWSDRAHGDRLIRWSITRARVTAPERPRHQRPRRWIRLQLTRLQLTRRRRRQPLPHSQRLRPNRNLRPPLPLQLSLSLPQLLPPPPPPALPPARPALRQALRCLRPGPWARGCRPLSARIPESPAPWPWPCAPPARARCVLLRDYMEGKSLRHR